MLDICHNKEFSFVDSIVPAEDYKVERPSVEILDSQTARLSATLIGPTDSQIIGRAWISDADGTLTEGVTAEVSAGTRVEIVLDVPDKQPLNGNLIACFRVEWPTFQTKHVVGCTLIEGEIVHPPRSKEC